MKIVFLDIDGVLNNFSTAFKGITWPPGGKGFIGFDPVNINNFNKLMSMTDAKIVISSAWRIGRTLEELISIFSQVGVMGEVIAKTKSLGRDRGFEIQDWLEFTGESVESFAIIDDSSDMAHLMNRLIKTPHMCGFQEIHIQKVLDMLDRPVMHWW